MELAEELEGVSLASPACSATLAGPETCVAASSGLNENSLLISSSEELEMESVEAKSEIHDRDRPKNTLFTVTPSVETAFRWIGVCCGMWLSRDYPTDMPCMPVRYATGHPFS